MGAPAGISAGQHRSDLARGPDELQPVHPRNNSPGGSQTIAQGPVAALESIENLGTNGGGFFNVNGAHPYQNPTPLTNVLEMLSIIVIPAALTNTFGRMVRNTWARGLSRRK